MRFGVDWPHRKNYPFLRDAYCLPMGMELSQAEVAALLAVAQDHTFGQPPGAQLRATVLGQSLANAAVLAPGERAVTWWTSTLRFLGCTGHSFELAAMFGDEVDLRAESLQIDASNPLEIVKLTAAHAGPGQSGLARIWSVMTAVATGRSFAEMNFRTACEVGDAFALRLGMDDEVRAALAATFERWNGRGLPLGIKGAAIPRAMRIAHLAQELEVLARVGGIDHALETVATRRSKAYDPELADLAIAHGRDWWSQAEAADPWEAALALAPQAAPLPEDELHQSLLVLADFADLKSPWINGHSRAVTALALEAGGPQVEVAALVHDLGRVAVPNSVWDKPGPLTRDERDRVEAHSLVSDQLVRRLPELAAAADAAGSAHERMDGSGYHRRASGAQLETAARVVAAADCYAAMTAARPHRAAMSGADAAAQLRAMAADGRLDGESVERVLAAAGHRRASRPPLPAGLSPREAEVLGLLALGLTSKEIAARLVISPKTVEHHIDHTYTKLGVSTRGAAALFAIEHGLLATDR